jgi:hypothetical protein
MITLGIPQHRQSFLGRIGLRNKKQIMALRRPPARHVGTSATPSPAPYNRWAVDGPGCSTGWTVNAKPPISTAFRPRNRSPDMSICVTSAQIRLSGFASVGDSSMVEKGTLAFVIEIIEVVLQTTPSPIHVIPHKS